MSDERPRPSSADPARNEPFEARLESFDFEAAGREPDVTDFFLRLMKRAALIGAARLEVLHERSEAERAALREAAEAAAAGRPDDVDAAAPRGRAAQGRIDLEYQRTTRAMRYCALLAMKLQKERLDREMGKAFDDEAASRKRKSRIKDQLERLVGGAIQLDLQAERERAAEARAKGDFSERDEPCDEATLYEQLSLRLDAEDIERDIETRPMGELFLRICRDFGFEPDLDRWKHLFWALEEARLRTPGSPFAERAAAEAAKPDAAEPPEPEAIVAEPEAPKPPEAEPEPEVPAASPLRNIDRMREWMRTPEYQRQEEERLARIRARYGPV